MTLPPFRFAVVGMHVLTDTGGADHLADVFPVLDHGVALAQRFQSDLVPNLNVVLGGEPKVRVVVRDNAQHVSPCGQPLHNDHANVVVVIMYEQLRMRHFTVSPIVTQESFYLNTYIRVNMLVVLHSALDIFTWEVVMAEPLYRTVYKEIIERIADGRYVPGAMLPSEFDVAAELGVSQGTARKALIALENDKIVERRQGRGTFVALRTPENSLFHFFRLRDKYGRPIVPALETEEICRRPATVEEKGLLYGNPPEVFEIIRIRSFNEKPLCAEIAVLPTALFPGLPDRAPLPNTLYVLFQQAYSCIVMSADDDLCAGIVDKELEGLSGFAAGTPVIVGKRKTYDLLKRTVELRTSYYLTQGVTYSVTLN